ncbi:uncharacterized protein LOC123566461 [Mercenaria mercenaria]|uniref:uncharacterized protein LOC123566461 n=1 Tax=Mercenaria mercenaria TaxID=6596 RepID=UPI00234F487D|nr:uncharacterized protein LOC123566461 [Mercenaria mercenaria]
MDFFIFNLLLLLFTYQFQGVLAEHHRRDDDDGYDDSKDDQNDLSDHCIHIRIDHDTRYTDYLICPFGCCGTLDDQKCCEDPEKAKQQEGHGNVHLVRGLLIFAGVMLVVALSCCVFGIYKHKKAKLRKTAPGGSTETRRRTPIERTAPYAVFYTPISGMRPGDDSKDRPKPHNKPERTAPTSDRTSPPRYTVKADMDPELPPYPSQGPPPPYSFGLVSAAPPSTELRIDN